MDVVGPPCHAHEKGTFFLCIEYEKWQIMSAYYNSKRRWCFDSLVTTPFFFFFWVFHFDLLCHGPCAKFSPLNSLRKFKRFTGLLCPNFLIILMWLIEWWEKKKSTNRGFKLSLQTSTFSATSLTTTYSCGEL